MKDNEDDVFVRDTNRKNTESKIIESNSHSSSNNEGKKMNTETVDDFTDPLQSYNLDEEIAEVKEKLSVAELPFSNSFRKSLDDTVLCISPYLMFYIPYLETEVVYFSEQFNNNTKIKIVKELDDDVKESNHHQTKPLHPFLVTKINNNDIQAMLAHFRACGGSYEKKEILCKCVSTPEEGIGGLYS
ncbi:hypothetical protein BDFB_011127 [Asbolus verrucosus]|uniref:Uncharacterized protein n=1 Tax=Asbolus verrucosus TaxID=1661398 RepID=A0A482VWS3_ASBVE|nr:hypothetical protein BDFB_011127 [Asbolus verrucosus]